MALCKNEFQIVNVGALLASNLAIPSYQRPYKWSTSSASNLFNDIYAEYKSSEKEYRLGTVILHKSHDKYYIVDGQQRLTTLAIILYALGAKTDITLLNQEYDLLSEPAIYSNSQIIQALVGDFAVDKEKFKKYILEKCEVVKIVTDSEQEAFQFFDSQNSRGKSLLPHDLLKSYHLREMKSENGAYKIELINSWENRKQEEIEQLFEMYLFPLSQWFKGKSGLYYSSSKIEEFKGIKIDFQYSYATHEKAANFFIELFNSCGNGILTGVHKLNQFQITKQLIAGRRFFEYTLHYMNLLEMVREKLKNNVSEAYMPCNKTGDRYVKQLFEAVSLFFVDRFGIDELTPHIIKKLHYWAFSLRLVMNSVYKETVNNYALGKSERLNKGLDIFTRINEMKRPGEINLIILDSPTCNPSHANSYHELKQYMGVKENE